MIQMSVFVAYMQGSLYCDVPLGTDGIYQSDRELI